MTRLFTAEFLSSHVAPGLMEHFDAYAGVVGLLRKGREIPRREATRGVDLDFLPRGLQFVFGFDQNVGTRRASLGWISSSV